MTHPFKRLPLLRPFRRFARDERGFILAETVVMLPVLLWAYLGLYVYFDAFSAKNTAIRGTYTIADLISRQTQTQTPTTIEGMNKIFDFITNAAGRKATTHIRVTDVYYDYVLNRYRVNWSAATRGNETLNDDTIGAYASQLPMPMLGDTELAVETWETYTPAFTVGPMATEFHNFVVVRPRMSPDVTYDPNPGGAGSS